MKKLVVLSGSGISAESGFSTFRDANGLWEQYPVEQVATPEGWFRNSELVTSFYNNLRKQLILAQPNLGHQLLASLENNFEVTVVTQNVDDLHERSGSHHVIHLHGELMKVCSSLDPNNPHFIKKLDKNHIEIKEGEKAGDGSLLRPWIVWFGEAVPMMDEAIKYARKADIFVIVGTSLNVYPAAGLIRFIPPNIPVYVIDPKEVTVNGCSNYVFINKTASEGMKELKNRLLQL